MADDTNGKDDVFVRDRQTEQTILVGINSVGEQGNGGSYQMTAISAEGRYVAFESSASNLVNGDTNEAQDIFVHDRDADVDGIFDERHPGAIETIRASVNSAGDQANNLSMQPAISGDGRYVVFSSNADNLVAGDTNLSYDIFSRDLNSRQTRRVSISSTGIQADHHSQDPSISFTGRYVAFTSQASTLVPAGTIVATVNVYVHDQDSMATTLVSVNSAGEAGNGGSQRPSISSGGRYVAFQSEAHNMGINLYDINIYVRDRRRGRTTQVSVGSSGAPANHTCAFPSLSANGRYVAFAAYANNLVENDTNRLQDIFVHDYLGDYLVIVPWVFPLLLSP